MPTTPTPTEQQDAPPLELSILELRDELARSRMREAFWISLVLHGLLALALALSPRYMKADPAVVVATAEDLIQDREVTYLDLPPDEQKVTEAPQTDIVSDKDRIASARNPQIDRETLRKLTDSTVRPGAPGPPSPVPPQPAGPQGQQQTPAPPAQSPGPAGGAPPQQSRPAEPDQVAKLEDLPAPKPKPGAFHTPMSPRAAIDQATRGAALSGVPGGGAGRSQVGVISDPTLNRPVAASQADILSDTMGVDFGPYLSRVLYSVRMNWEVLMPEIARPPEMKQGRVVIQFAILNDGKVAGMQLNDGSGDSSLDRAAWGAILGSNPFPPLPKEFPGKYLALRFSFHYNPEENRLR